MWWLLDLGSSTQKFGNRAIGRAIGRTSRAAGLRLSHTCLPWTVYAFVARVHTQENQGSHRD